MAALYKNGTEVGRFYGINQRGEVTQSIYSIRSNGIILVKYQHCGWKRWGRKKPDVSLEGWIASWRDKIAKMPPERRLPEAARVAFGAAKQWAGVK